MPKEFISFVLLKDIMIHRLVVLDRNKSIGTTLFDNGHLSLQSDLLIGLVQALMLLGEEMGPSKGALREAELGKYQIGILSKDHLAYIIIQDSYDSEPFTSRILNLVLDEFHETLSDANLNQKLENEDEVKSKVKELLTTMKFPKKALVELKNIVKTSQINHNFYIDTLLLADLDDGIVDIIKDPNDKNIIKILMEILSEIPFERHWIGESKLRRPEQVDGDVDVEKKNYEAWVIYRIGLTDFCFIGRAYYNHGTERDNLINALEQMTENSMSLLLSYGIENV